MHHKDIGGELSCTACYCLRFSSQPQIYIAVWKSLAYGHYCLGHSLGVSNFSHQGKPSKGKQKQISTSIVRSIFVCVNKERTHAMYSFTLARFCSILKAQIEVWRKYFKQPNITKIIFDSQDLREAREKCICLLNDISL